MVRVWQALSGAPWHVGVNIMNLAAYNSSMKTIHTPIPVLLVILLLGGCQSMGPNAQRGAATGAATGAIAGWIIGHQSDEDGKGAAIGAASGALIGGLLGDADDKDQAAARQQAIERARERKQKAETKRRQLISFGKSVDDPQVLAARQKAEAAEAELARLRKEQEDAIQRAKKIQEFEERERRAREEARRLREGGS
ncbi:MAG: hypothetical protein CMJ20_13195 [Phycisphaeraceae bacterium]|nr:hypothetical protein [Phycisphaeraceae bacterium]